MSPRFAAPVLLLLIAAAPPLRVEVWLRDGAGPTAPSAPTVALRDAVVASLAAHPPALAAGPPKILYLADDLRWETRHHRFRYVARLTDHAFTQTVTITGECRPNAMAACARGLLRRSGLTTRSI